MTDHADVIREAHAWLQRSIDSKSPSSAKVFAEALQAEHRALVAERDALRQVLRQARGKTNSDIVALIDAVLDGEEVS